MLVLVNHAKRVTKNLHWGRIPRRGPCRGQSGVSPPQPLRPYAQEPSTPIPIPTDAELFQED
jgi:hypothetical protein